jgi:hypothetical protein
MTSSCVNLILRFVEDINTMSIWEKEGIYDPNCIYHPLHLGDRTYTYAEAKASHEEGKTLKSILLNARTRIPLSLSLSLAHTHCP